MRRTNRVGQFCADESRLDDVCASVRPARHGTNAAVAAIAIAQGRVIIR
jgi:hypothetical protein